MQQPKIFENKKRKPLFIVLFIALFFAITAVVMLLWNAVLPSVLNVNAITYWQAMGILVLSKILFGNFGGKGRTPFAKKINSEKAIQFMGTDKERFKEEFLKRCGKD